MGTPVLKDGARDGNRGGAAAWLVVMTQAPCWVGVESLACSCPALTTLLHLSCFPEVTRGTLQTQTEPRELIALACLKATLKVLSF